MPQGATPLSQVLGFFTVVQRPDVGWYGGYLLLNGVGRPIEFHCTAPVRPSRAQQILYGPTLGAFLLGEQIGPALLTKAKATADMILTDQRDGLALAERVESPVLLVSIAGTDDEATGRDDSADAVHPNGLLTGGAALPPGVRLDSPHSGAAGLKPHLRMTLGPRAVELSPLQRERADDVRAFYESLPHGLDLAEPFARIVGAIGEAHKAVR